MWLHTTHVFYRVNNYVIAYNINGLIFQEDTFTVVTFYFHYALVLVQFALLFVPDVKALRNTKHRKTFPGEETPLLGDMKDATKQMDEGIKVNQSQWIWYF